jgi:hypothetical protein
MARLSNATKDRDPEGLLHLREAHRKFQRALQQAQALARPYHVVVANPLYLGGKQMTAAAKDNSKREYPESKSDFFSMFMDRGFDMVSDQGLRRLWKKQAIRANISV